MNSHTRQFTLPVLAAVMLALGLLCAQEYAAHLTAHAAVLDDVPREAAAADLPGDGAPSGGAREAAEAGPPDDWAMIWTLLGIFLGGMALNLTPCVYPLIPITVSYFGGRATSEKNGRGRLAVHGLCYMLGLTVTNSALGVTAALTGGLVGAFLQNPFVLVGVSVVLVLLATSLFGWWNLRLPAGLAQAAARSYSGYAGSLFMGLTLGIVAAPCIGPFVLGLLTWVAAVGSPWVGFLVFFILSLGLGTPLFALALFSGQLEKLPRSGEWMVWVRRLMGWVLVGMAVRFVTPVLPDSLGVPAVAAVAFAAAVDLGWRDRTKASFRAFAWIRMATGIAGVALAAVLLASSVLLGPGVAWIPYSEEVVRKAVLDQKPVIIDFSAEWCAPCRQMDEKTFHDPRVVERAARDFVMVRVDLTHSGDPLRDKVVLQYGVRGVPTVLFIGADGRERRELRVAGFIPPEGFLARMAGLSRGRN